MGHHILQSSLPVFDVKVDITEPRIPIYGGAAPGGLGNLIVQMNINPLPVAFLGHHVESLQPRRLVCDLRIDLSDLLIYSCAVDLPEGIDQRGLDCHICSIVINVIDHLSGKGQSDDIHAKARKLGYRGFNRCILQAFWYHCLQMTRPVGSSIGHRVSTRITNPPF